ncbi:hypothetical protein OROMI_007575 [Orobanche minor]
MKLLLHLEEKILLRMAIFMLPQASIDFAIQYVRPACLGLGGVMFGFGYYLQSKITNAVVKTAVLAGLIVAIKLLEELEELQHSCDRNRNSGGGSLTAMVPLTSVLQHVGLACLTVVVAMSGLGYILSYLSPSGITSAVLNAVVLFFFLLLASSWTTLAFLLEIEILVVTQVPGGAKYVHRRRKSGGWAHEIFGPALAGATHAVIVQATAPETWSYK